MVTISCGVQIQRQRPFHRDLDLDHSPGLIGTGDAFRSAADRQDLARSGEGEFLSIFIMAHRLA